jgi:hypothetical protein
VGGDIIRWAWDVLSHWQVLVTGGAITAILAIIQLRRGESLPWRIYRWILLAFFVIALFLSWRDQYRAKIALEHRLSQLSVPVIAGRIPMIGLGRGGPTGDDSLLLLVVFVTNTGAPSALDINSVTVRVKGKEAIAKAIPLEEDGFNIVDSAGVLRHFDPSDNLPLRLLSPLPTGGEVMGFLHLFVSGISATDLHIPGAVIDIELQDVFGGLHPIHWEIDNMEHVDSLPRNLQPKNTQP